ncbi:ATP-binding protein [Novosphingobium sp. TCA1]|uniref:sensor histidine kinase n=1 Tax=Novosphingobium sp. TCA1 TaxID=2682474 RepID=UPI0013096A5C|nr:ATP-binding protein [Novosphingobium sp. TCA1]GFE72519.1 two-component sensor histidine kinase [Novosphingobium sp. TCA1]
MTRRQTLYWLLAALAAAVLFGSVGGEIVRRRATAAFAASVSADARLRQALLNSEIARFRLLPQTLADDRDVIAAADGEEGAERRLNAKLEAFAGQIGASAIYLVGENGFAIAASNWRRADSFVGRDYRFRRYYRDALRHGDGAQFALGTVSHRPGLYLARKAAGDCVIVIKLEFARIEAQWRTAGGETFVTNRDGVVLVSSRPAWRFAMTRPIDPARQKEIAGDIGIPGLKPAPYGADSDGFLRMPGRTERLQLATSPPNRDAWRVNLALPIRLAVTTPVRSAQAVAATLALVAVGALWWLAQRNRRRRERTALLEAAVTERTAELRREMEERTALEQRAALLREELRLANRLATLGQVTASVAHETAQPVAAIRNYARSAGQLLDLGEAGEVRENLSAIDRLAERIGVITAQLRGFARKASGAESAVSLAEVVDGAQLLLKERLAALTFERPAIAADLKVRGDKVRLEQILVNLLQNATEALAGRPDPRIRLSVEASHDVLCLRVADNGPGIAPEIADRLFTPFATSRAEGLGLGLVIAQDIAQEFGGSLRLVPDRTGAVFELELRLAR